MRALTKFQTDYLRVENPPITRIDPVLENGSYFLNVKICFAYNAVKASSGFGRAVRLELKTGANPAVPSSTSAGRAPSLSIATILEKKHIEKLADSSRGVFVFDVLKAVPDYSIAALAAGRLIEYQYLQAVTSPSVAQTDVRQRISPPEYLIGKLRAGVDPATLRENFPVPDPAKSSKSIVTYDSVLDDYFTRPTTRSSAYINARKLSNFAIFEETIKLALEDFVSLTAYEFSFLSSDGTPREFVEVNVDTAAIVSQMKKIELTDTDGVDLNYSLDGQLPRLEQYVRTIRSIDSLTSSEFNLNQEGLSAGQIGVTRRHYTKTSGEVRTPKFESEVFPRGGVSSQLSKITNKTTQNKPFVIPFYIDNDGQQLRVKITKVPQEARRLSVLARNITRNDLTFTEIASGIISTRPSDSITLGPLRDDCTYEFKIETIDLKMRSRVSANSLVYYYKVPRIGASIGVSQPALIGDQGVKFSVSVNLTPAGNGDIRDVNKNNDAAGVPGSTTSDDSSNPASYNDVYTYRVEKINLDTGEQVYTRELPISESLTEYIDEVDTQNGAVFVFSLASKSVTSSYSTQAGYKWGYFGGRPLTSLPSSLSLANASIAGPEFTLIDSGVKKVIYVATTRLRGAVSSISLSKTMRETNLLEWEYSGDDTEVDHFQVLGSADGVECLLGCSFRSNTFEDAVLYGRVGIVRYTIRPVYLSMEIGAPFSVSVRKLSTLPPIIEEGFSNGQSSITLVTAINTQMQVDQAAGLPSLEETYDDPSPSESETGTGDDVPTGDTSSRQAVSFTSGTSTRTRNMSRTLLSKSASKGVEVESGFVTYKKKAVAQTETEFKSVPVYDTQAIRVPTNSFTVQAAKSADKYRNSTQSQTITARRNSVNEKIASQVGNAVNDVSRITSTYASFSTSEVDGIANNAVKPTAQVETYVSMQDGVEVVTTSKVSVNTNYTSTSTYTAYVARMR